MAALPSIKQIRVEDVLKPDGALDGERLVGILNQFMLGVYTALDRNLTFVENFRGLEKTLSFRTKAAVADTFPLYFEVPAGTTVRGAIVIKAIDRSSAAGEFVNGVTAHVLPGGNGRAEVRYISGLDASTPYEITFQVIG
jgi:hypothetical protein